MGSSTERHEWLEKARVYCTSLLAEVSCTVPTNVRVTVGFPSTGGRGKRIGECVYDGGVSDQHHEVFVSPVLGDGVRILDVLIHELIHTANPTAKHGKGFKTPAVAVGLIGKMTATEAGPELKAKFTAWVKANGDYPAGSVSLTERKKQTTRLLKAECETCGYIVRVTGKWVTEVGPPHCPDHGAMTVEGLSETNPEDDPPEDEEIVTDDEPELEDQPEVANGGETDLDEQLTGYKVTQDDPEHVRSAYFMESERPAAEAKARQWSKTGTERQCVCRAYKEGSEVGSKAFFGGLAAPNVTGEYPL